MLSFAIPYNTELGNYYPKLKETDRPQYLFPDMMISRKMARNEFFAVSGKSSESLIAILERVSYPIPSPFTKISLYNIQEVIYSYIEIIDQERKRSHNISPRDSKHCFPNKFLSKKETQKHVQMTQQAEWDYFVAATNLYGYPKKPGGSHLMYSLYDILEAMRTYCLTHSPKTQCQ